MKPTPSHKIMTLRIPAELYALIPPEWTLSKFIVQAIRDKLERDKK